MRRVRDVEREDSADVRKEEILNQTSNEYEAIVAIAKEARRLNSVPGVFLDNGEGAIPRAVENFVGGRVEYVVEGGECEECGPDREKAGKKTRKTAGKTSGKVGKKGGRKK